MKARESAVGVCFWALVACGVAIGQGPSQWPCSDEIAKAESGGHKIRVSAGVSNRIVQKKVLPDISDLIDKKLDSLIILRVILDTRGNVRCARPEQGDADLFPRSIEAAEQWRFRPYQANGETLVVETQIQFRYKKNRVEVVVPDR